MIFFFGYQIYPVLLHVAIHVLHSCCGGAWKSHAKVLAISANS